MLWRNPHYVAVRFILSSWNSVSHLQHKNTAIQSTMCAFQLMVITAKGSEMCDTSLVFSCGICCLLKDIFFKMLQKCHCVCWSVLDSGQNPKKIIGGGENLLVLSWHFSCSLLWLKLGNLPKCEFICSGLVKNVTDSSKSLACFF